MTRRDYKEIFYPESRYGGFTDIDGTLVFYSRVNALLGSDAIVLDAGCGTGRSSKDEPDFKRNLRSLKGKCRRVIGIDVDPHAAANPFVDEFRTIGSGKWPVETESVDLCVSDFVLEHLERPENFFGELARVVKPGGYFCARTPNLLSYFGILSRLIPNKYHAAVTGKVQSRREAEDVFPVYYRCNTAGRLRSMLAAHGFEHRVYGYEAEPCYASFSRFFYGLGVIHQRFMPHPFKITLFVFARKPLQP